MNIANSTFQFLHIRNRPTLFILTPFCLPYTYFVDYAHLSTNYRNISSDYTNFFANCAHNFDDYANTLDDRENIVVDSINTPNI
jgi:hypothetical protein